MADELKPQKVLSDFKRAYVAKADWLKEAEEDFLFVLGKQWDDDDVETLRKVGVRALTINKIRPNIQLITGIESQNRSDFKAFPEGGEDSLKAEIATVLMKNVMKTANGDYIVSEQFEDGTICGESFLEPYLDYTENLINGEMKLRKADFNQFFPDPDSKSYDLSDAKYVCKVTFDLSKDELLTLFPNKEAQIKAITNGKLDLSAAWLTQGVMGAHLQKSDYPRQQEAAPGDEPEEPRFDLLEYYYKKYIPTFFVADLKQGRIQQTRDQAEAENFVKVATENDPPGKPSARVIKKMVPEIWVASMVGRSDKFLENDHAWSCPRWKGYPLIPFYAHRSTAPIKNKEYKVQGIARSMKDGNRQYNKLKTQELRHLNSSANSGWQCDDDTLTPDQENDYRKYGSAPGIVLKHKSQKEAPRQIFPSPLSQGHAQLAAECSQDLKEGSGINADLLAMQDGGQASGRA
ncbi:MAG: hypothetical protein HY548_07145, partial [Elusimicrobia bacterium]|nr:hypothetical protein [Elusimicrobiota bacterium]